MSDVVIVGAGPAGLMAAYTAAQRGRSVTVIEAGESVGGMAGSFTVADQRVDFGSHRLHPATPAPLLELIGGLLGGDLQVRSRSGRIRLAGRWIDFPLRAVGMVGSLPPGLTLRLVGDSIATTGRAARSRLPGRSAGGERGATGSSFHDEIVRRLGPTVATELYGPYARKLYGLDPGELDGELARRRVSASSPAAIVRRLARAARPSGRTFLYPRRGYGQIVEALAEAAVDAGATIHLGHPVTRIGAGATGDRARAGATGVTMWSGERCWSGGVGLSTVPIPTMVSVLDPSPPEPVVQAVARAGTRAMLLVYLVVDRPRYTSFDAHYLPGPETVIARLSEPKNYRDGDDPPDRTVLCAEIACSVDDELWRWSDGDLIDLVADDLGRLGLPEPAVVGGEVRRLRSVYPVYDRAGVKDRAVVDRWIRSLDTVLSLGRQGLAVVDNLHHVLEMGRDAASVIEPGGVVDLPRWRGHLDRYRDNVVED